MKTANIGPVFVAKVLKWIRKPYVKLFYFFLLDLLPAGIFYLGDV